MEQQPIEPTRSLLPKPDEILENVREQSAELEALLLSFNTFDMLANLMFAELAYTDGQYAEEHEDRLPAAIEYAALLYLKRPFNIGTERTIDDAIVGEVRQRIQTIILLTAFYFSARAAEGAEDAEDTAISEVRSRVIMAELTVRNLGYAHHVKEALSALFTPFSSWMAAHVGFEISDIFMLDDALSEIASRRLTEARIRGRESIEQLRKAVERFASSGDFTGSFSEEEIKHLAAIDPSERDNAILDLSARDFFDNLGSLLSFTVEEMAAHTGIADERVRACLDFFTLDFESQPPDWFLFSPTHHLKLRPLIRAGERYLCPDPALFLWAAQPRLEACLNPDVPNSLNTDRKLWINYRDGRASYVEHETIRLFTLALKHAQAYHSLSYDMDDQRLELDGLILFDETLFLLEAKGGSFSPPARRGAPDRLLKNIKELVVDAHEQALHAKQHIESTDTPTFIPKKGKKVVIDKSHIKRTFLVTVTLDPIDVINANLHETLRLNLFAEGDLPWAVSLYSLRVIAEMIEFPAMLVHYLIRRLRVTEQGKVMTFDELDLFGHYLAEGLYFERSEFQEADRISISTYTEAFDLYYFHEMGKPGGSDTKPTQPIPDTMRAIINELERKHDLGYVDVVCHLLDLNSQSREKFAEGFTTRRQLTQEDGKQHSFAMVASASPGSDLRSGISIFSDAPNTEQELEKCVDKLDRYSEVKKYQVRAHQWLALLTVTNSPNLIKAWITYDGEWKHNPQIEQTLHELGWPTYIEE